MCIKRNSLSMDFMSAAWFSCCLSTISSSWQSTNLAYVPTSCGDKHLLQNQGMNASTDRHQSMPCLKRELAAVRAQPIEEAHAHGPKLALGVTKACLPASTARSQPGQLPVQVRAKGKLETRSVRSQPWAGTTSLVTRDPSRTV